MTHGCKRKSIEIPIFKELRTVEGDEESVLWDAGTQTWADKYIQVKLKLSKPTVGIGDKIRQAFSERGGEVLSVEVERAEATQGPVISVEEMERPEKIFAQFHQEKFDGELPDETLAQTFRELLQMVSDTRQ